MKRVVLFFDYASHCYCGMSSSIVRTQVLPKAVAKTLYEVFWLCSWMFRKFLLLLQHLLM